MNAMEKLNNIWDSPTIYVSRMFVPSICIAEVRGELETMDSHPTLGHKASEGSDARMRQRRASLWRLVYFGFYAEAEKACACDRLYGGGQSLSGPKSYMFFLSPLNLPDASKPPHCTVQVSVRSLSKTLSSLCCRNLVTASPADSDAFVQTHETSTLPLRFWTLCTNNTRI